MYVYITCNYESFTLACIGFVGEGLGFAERENLVWYVLFIIFVPYSMLPLPLKWCMIGGSLSAFSHLIVMIIVKFQRNTVSLSSLCNTEIIYNEWDCNVYFIILQDKTCAARQLLANSLLYLAINFAGMYTKYLTDRGQRLAFIETHKAMEHKKESEREYQRTQKLLDSSRLNLFANNLFPYIKPFKHTPIYFSSSTNVRE